MISHIIKIAALFFIFHGIVSCSGKDGYLEKPVESINGLYLKDIADRLSENFNRTNNEELGVTYIKVS